MSSYNIEEYWSKVAKEIDARTEGDSAFVAGDDEPYYVYKRKLFIDKFLSLQLSNKSVLEVGCGPGGNLKLAHDHFSSTRIAGCDISQSMIKLASKNLPNEIDLTHINGRTIPKKENEFDVVFTSTVLQHITDEEMLKDLITSITRVAQSEIYLFERIEKRINGNQTNTGRPVSYYSNLFNGNGFELEKHEFIPTTVSRVTSGVIRRLLNSAERTEGQKQSRIARSFQAFILWLTKPLDKVFKFDSGLCMLKFVSKSH